jgi:hypothetical protein
MRRSLAGRIAALEQRQDLPPPADRPGPDFDAMSDTELDAWLEAHEPPPLTPAQEAWHQALDEADDALIDAVLAWHQTGQGSDPLAARVAAILQQQKGRTHGPKRI